MDRSYKVHGIADDPMRNGTAFFISGQRKGVTKSIRKLLQMKKITISFAYFLAKLFGISHPKFIG